jgi:hypothetical protein
MPADSAARPGKRIMAPPSTGQDDLLEDLRRQTAEAEARREAVRAAAAAEPPALGSVANACVAGVWGILVYIGWSILLGLAIGLALWFYLGSAPMLLLLAGVVGLLINAGITGFAAFKGARSALDNCGGRWIVAGAVYIGSIAALNLGIGALVGPRFVDIAGMATAIVFGALYVIGWAWVHGDD